MEIIHDLSKLKIETTDSSSSQEEEEEEVKRNWLELPPDVMSLIFLKLGYIYILGSAQWVCSSWWKLSKHPHLFRSIHVEQVSTVFERSLNINPLNPTTKFSEGLAREAIDRSCGQLVDFSIRGRIPIDELLQYMTENPFRSSSLRSLRLVNVRLRVANRLLKVAKKLPHLEELGIIKCYHDVFMSGSIAAVNMPELRHLNLFGNWPTGDDDLRAILDGCPHLETLDLRQCILLHIGGDLKERCKNIKVLRRPYDPTDDFEYDSEYRGNYDDENDVSDHYVDLSDGCESS